MSLPRHIAIIMDGNGRWAQARGHQRTYGHIRGARTAKSMIRECAERKVDYLTLYAFSMENWSRPTSEVGFLMNLLKRHLERERANLVKQNIRFNCIGNFDRVPKEVLREIKKTIDATHQNTGMVLTFAISYGSKQEITSAVKSIAKKVSVGELNWNDIDSDLIESHLETYPCPDPDLIIRTSGESRLSNFLLWQLAYSELYFTDTLWPDFTKHHLDIAISSFQDRSRRYGAIEPTLSPSKNINL